VGEVIVPKTATRPGARVDCSVALCALTALSVTILSSGDEVLDEVDKADTSDS
jgi:hypothetical protein